MSVTRRTMIKTLGVMSVAGAIAAASAPVGSFAAAVAEKATGARVLTGPSPIPGAEAAGAGDITLMNERLAISFAVDSDAPWGLPKGSALDAAPVVDGKIDFGADCNHCGRCVGKCPFHAVDDSTRGYRVYIGGRWGKKFARGQFLSPIFTSEEEVMGIVEKAILLFRDQGITGERFQDTVNRLGLENVERQLLGNELLERRDEILGAEKHTVGGATC